MSQGAERDVWLGEPRDTNLQYKPHLTHSSPVSQVAGAKICPDSSWARRFRCFQLNPFCTARDRPWSAFDYQPLLVRLRLGLSDWWPIIAALSPITLFSRSCRVPFLPSGVARQSLDFANAGRADHGRLRRPTCSRLRLLSTRRGFLATNPSIIILRTLGIYWRTGIS